MSVVDTDGARLRFGLVTVSSIADGVKVDLDGEEVVPQLTHRWTPKVGDTAWMVQQDRRLVMIGYRRPLDPGLIGFNYVMDNRFCYVIFSSNSDWKVTLDARGYRRILSPVTVTWMRPDHWAGQTGDHAYKGDWSWFEVDAILDNGQEVNLISKAMSTPTAQVSPPYSRTFSTDFIPVDRDIMEIRVTYRVRDQATNIPHSFSRTHQVGSPVWDNIPWLHLLHTIYNPDTGERVYDPKIFVETFYEARVVSGFQSGQEWTGWYSLMVEPVMGPYGIWYGAKWTAAWGYDGPYPNIDWRYGYVGFPGSVSCSGNRPDGEGVGGTHHISIKNDTYVGTTSGIFTSWCPQDARMTSCTGSLGGPGETQPPPS